MIAFSFQAYPDETKTPLTKWCVPCTDSRQAATGVTDTYTYSNAQWKDQLTAYNGSAFTYDGIGNPTKYNNGNSYTMQWQNGRELYMTYKNTSVKTFYAYGENGNRTIKNTNSAGGDKFLYYYAGDRLISQVWDDGARSINFLYDENGSPYGFVYRNNTATYRYYYIKNLQGDVIALLDQYHDIAAYYAYDAWGKLLYIRNASGGVIAATADHIANLNPIRYRSYYYDTETGFYYLNTRYYDPAIGRFINADGYVTTGQGFLSYNMYAYCLNNPVNNVDFSGNWTMGFSLGINLTAFLGISVSIGFFWDDNGNAEWQWSYSVPGVDDTVSIGVLDAGASLSFQYTNADTVNDLYGHATYIGASVGSGLYAGADIITFDDISDPSVNNDGFQVTLGYGVGVDTHITKTYTKPIREKENQLYKILTFKEKRL